MNRNVEMDFLRIFMISWTKSKVFGMILPFKRAVPVEVNLISMRVLSSKISSLPSSSLRFQAKILAGWTWQTWNLDEDYWYHWNDLHGREHHEQVMVYGNSFASVVDVGAQKWANCAVEFSCVVFVVSLTEYDQVMIEDSTTNRMKESLVLFKEISASRWFTQVPIVLVMNKYGLFEKNLKKVPLNECFPQYQGKFLDLEIYSYLRNQMNQRQPSTLLRTHFLLKFQQKNLSMCAKDRL